MQELNELKNLVIQTLQANGSLSDIRAQIRSSVFKVVDEPGTEKKVSPFHWENVKCQGLHDKPYGKQFIQLIKQFFQFYNMDYTNCVFASEANMREQVKRQALALKLDFYSGAIILRFQHPSMIITGTKDIFLRRLLRYKKMLTQDGSSDESPEESKQQQKTVILHTEHFLDSINSSQLSKRTTSKACVEQLRSENGRYNENRDFKGQDCNAEQNTQQQQLMLVFPSDEQMFDKKHHQQQKHWQSHHRSNNTFFNDSYDTIVHNIHDDPDVEAMESNNLSTVKIVSTQQSKYIKQSQQQQQSHVQAKTQTQAQAQAQTQAQAQMHKPIQTGDKLLLQSSHSRQSSSSSETFADKLSKLQRKIALNEFIFEQSHIEMNFNNFEDDVAHLIADFDEVDVDMVLGLYARLNNRAEIKEDTTGGAYKKAKQNNEEQQIINKQIQNKQSQRQQKVMSRGRIFTKTIIDEHEVEVNINGKKLEQQPLSSIGNNRVIRTNTERVKANHESHSNQNVIGKKADQQHIHTRIISLHNDDTYAQKSYQQSPSVHPSADEQPPIIFTQTFPHINPRPDQHYRHFRQQQGANRISAFYESPTTAAAQHQQQQIKQQKSSRVRSKANTNKLMAINGKYNKNDKNDDKSEDEYVDDEYYHNHERDDYEFCPYHEKAQDLPDYQVQADKKLSPSLSSEYLTTANKRSNHMGQGSGSSPSAYNTQNTLNKYKSHDNLLYLNSRGQYNNNYDRQRQPRRKIRDWGLQQQPCQQYQWQHQNNHHLYDHYNHHHNYYHHQHDHHDHHDHYGYRYNPNPNPNPKSKYAPLSDRRGLFERQPQHSLAQLSDRQKHPQEVFDFNNYHDHRYHHDRNKLFYDDYDNFNDHHVGHDYQKLSSARGRVQTTHFDYSHKNKHHINDSDNESSNREYQHQLQRHKSNRTLRARGPLQSQHSQEQDYNRKYSHNTKYHDFHGLIQSQQLYAAQHPYSRKQPNKPSSFLFMSPQKQKVGRTAKTKYDKYVPSNYYGDHLYYDQQQPQNIVDNYQQQPLPLTTSLELLQKRQRARRNQNDINAIHNYVIQEERRNFQQLQRQRQLQQQQQKQLIRVRSSATIHQHNSPKSNYHHPNTQQSLKQHPQQLPYSPTTTQQQRNRLGSPNHNNHNLKINSPSLIASPASPSHPSYSTVENKQQKKQKLRDRAVQLLNKVKSQEYLMSRGNRTPYQAK